MRRATGGVTYSRLIVDALTRYGDRPALVDEGGTLSYAAAADLCGRMRRILAERGVGLGTGVGALSPNRSEVWLVQAATYVAAGRYTGLHPLGSEDDHVWVCDDAEISVLIVDPMFAARAGAIAARAATVKHVFTLGPADVGEDLLALCANSGPAPLDAGTAVEEDIGWLQYTGGTTGRPKGVMLSQRAMVQQLQSFLASFAVPENPRYLAAAPITHAGLLPLLPTLVRGGTVVLHKTFDPERWLRTVQEQRISYGLAVPTMIYALLDAGDPGRYDLSSLRTVVYGASPMAPTRLAEALDTFGSVFLQGYGSSECTGTATSLLSHEHDPVGRPELLTSCGRAVVGAEVEVLDDNGDEVGPGVAAELCVRGRAVMTGYWKLPEETAEAIGTGWLRTGDIAERNEDGFFFIVDRKQDLIISGGFNIYPRAVEDVLSAHPSVAMAAVIGVPDEKWGEAVKAIVVPRPGAEVDAGALMDLVRAKKGAHSAPKSVDVVESLPLTPVGKVDKKVLRAGYWAGQTRQVH